MDSSVMRRSLAGLIVALALAAAGPAHAGTTSFTMDPLTLQSLLQAMTPYDLVVGKGGLSETLTLTNPRDVQFKGGKISLRLDCQGAPIPFDAVLRPVISLRWNETRRGWEARIEELPLSIPVLGTVNLAEHIRPLTIPSLFSQSAGEGADAITIDAKILSLRVLDTMIQVGADVSFRPAPAQPPAAPARRSSSR